MDKNMINIDDLFRQRLSGGEEEEKAGAWSNMRNLLDEQMPAVKPAAGIRWGRMLTYTAGLLLLASAAIGGYEAITAYRTTNNTASNTSSDNVASAGRGATVNNNGVHGAPAVAGIADNVGTHITTTHTTNYSTESTTAITTGNKSTRTTSAASLDNKNGVAISSTTSGNRIANDTKVVNGKLVNVNASAHHKTGVSNVALNNSVASNQKLKSTASSTTTSGNKKNNIPSGTVLSSAVAGNQKQKSIQHRNALTASTAKVTGNHKHATLKNKTGILPASGTTASNGQLADNTGTVTDKQRVDKIDIVQRYVQKPGGREGHYLIDTIDRTQLSLEKTRHTQGQPDDVAESAANNNAVSPNQVSSAMAATSTNTNISNTGTPSARTTSGSTNVSSSSTNTNPTVAKTGVGTSTAAKTNTPVGAQNSTAASNNAGANVLLASASKTTTSSKTTDALAAHSNRKGSTTLSNFAEMIHDFKTNIGNAKFAPGITGGINSAFFAPNSTSGFQLGVTGNFTFNDHWSFMGELKYFSRFSSNATINDNYVNYTPAGSGYLKDSVQRYFKYNNLQSVELPLTLRYTTGKYTMYLGANIVYDFAINNDYVENEYPTTIETMSGKNIKPQFTETAFASRFGVGYLFGVGYHITPVLQADVRMVQTVWDNSSTNGGAQILSNNLYKTPSFQLSIGYTIKRQESKMP